MRTMNLSEAEDQITMGIRASGEMDSDQTRQALQLSLGGDMAHFQASGVGSHDPSSMPRPGGEGGEDKPKTKRQVPLSKQVSTKISQSSSKLTELTAWTAKVNDNTALSRTLLDGFQSELTSRKNAILEAKSSLETVYAQTLGKSEQDLLKNQTLTQEIAKHIASVDAAFTCFNGTIKSIKMAIDPPPKKTKATAKAKVEPSPKAAA